MRLDTRKAATRAAPFAASSTIGAQIAGPQTTAMSGDSDDSRAELRGAAIAVAPAAPQTPITATIHNGSRSHRSRKRMPRTITTAVRSAEVKGLR